jgi:hypothetical protein
MAMLTVCQIPQQPAGFGIGYDSARIFQGAPAPMGHGLRLAHKGFLDHL